MLRQGARNLTAGRGSATFGLSQENSPGMQPAGHARAVCVRPHAGMQRPLLWPKGTSMSDLSKLTKAQLLALIDNGSTTTAAPIAMSSTKRKAKTAKKRSFTKHLTESFTLVTDRRAGNEGFEWASDYAELAFCDAEGNAHTGALREDDTLGKNLIEEIKTFARENAIGRSKVRYNRKINAWAGPLAMFPARLRKLSGI